jgi:hypothetical protein
MGQSVGRIRMVSPVALSPRRHNPQPVDPQNRIARRLAGEPATHQPANSRTNAPGVAPVSVLTGLQQPCDGLAEAAPGTVVDDPVRSCADFVGGHLPPRFPARPT